MHVKQVKQNRRGLSKNKPQIADMNKSTEDRIATHRNKLQARAKIVEQLWLTKKPRARNHKGIRRPKLRTLWS